VSKENIDKLYSAVSADKRYTGSYEDFVSEMDNPEYRDKVYESITQSGEFTEGRDSFDIHYRNEAKGVLGAVEGTAKKDNLLYKALGGGKVDKNKLRQVDWQMMGLQEDEVIENLKQMYGEDTFEFSDSVIPGFDYVYVKHKESGKELKLSVDNFTDNAKKENAAKLNEFIAEYNPEPVREEIFQSHAVNDKYSTLKTLITSDVSEDTKKQLRIKAERALANEFQVKPSELTTENWSEGFMDFFGTSFNKLGDAIGNVDIRSEAHKPPPESNIIFGERGFLGWVDDKILNSNTTKHYNNALDQLEWLEENDPEKYISLFPQQEQLGELVIEGLPSSPVGVGSQFTFEQKQEVIKNLMLESKHLEEIENYKVNTINDYLDELTSDEREYFTSVAKKEDKETHAKRQASGGDFAKYAAADPDLKDLPIVKEFSKERQAVNRMDDVNQIVNDEYKALQDDFLVLNKKIDNGEKVTKEDIISLKERQEIFKNTANLLNKAKHQHLKLNSELYNMGKVADYTDRMGTGWDIPLIKHIPIVDDVVKAITSESNWYILGNSVAHMAEWSQYGLSIGFDAIADKLDSFQFVDGKISSDLNNIRSGGSQMFGKWAEMTRETSDWLEKGVEERKKRYRKTPVGLSGGVDVFMEKALAGVAENLPNLMLAAATGGGSLPANMAVYGASGAINTHKDMIQEIERGEAKYTTDQLIQAPLLHGAFEAFTMLPEYFMLKGAGVLGKSKPGAFGVVDDALLTATRSQKVGRAVMGFTKSQTTEITQEVFTQVGQNWTDKYILGKDVDIADGIDADFFIKTFGSTGAFHIGPRALQGTMGLLGGQMLEADNVRMNNYGAKLLSLRTDIAHLNKMLLGETGDAVNNAVSQGPKGERDRERIKEEIQEKEIELAKTHKEAEQLYISINNRYRSLNRKGVNMLRGLAKQSGALRNEAKKVKADDTLSRGEKRRKLRKLKERFAEVEEKKKQLINNDKSYQLQDGRTSSALERRARKELMDQGKVNPTTKQVETRAQRIFNEENKSSDAAIETANNTIRDQIAKFEAEALIGKINSIDPSRPIEKFEGNTLQEAKDWLTDNLKEKGIPQGEIDNWIKDLESTWEGSTASILQPKVKGKKANKDTHMFDKHQIIIVNAKKSALNKNYQARGHEILHAIVWKAFKASGIGFKTMAKGMENLIKTQDEVGARWLKNRMKLYKNKSGKLDNVYYEEVIMAIADGIRAGYIKNNADTRATVNSSLMKAIKSVFPGTKDAGPLLINDAQDMLNLISKYSRSLKTGDVDIDVVKAAGGDVQVSEELNVIQQKKENAKFKKSMDMLSRSAKEVFSEAVQIARKVKAANVNDVYGKFKNKNIESFDALSEIGLAYDEMFNKAIKQFENEHNITFGQSEIDTFKFEAIYGDRGIRGALIFDPLKPRKVFDENVQVVIDGVMQNNRPAKYLNGLLPQRMIEFAVKAIPNLDEYYAKDIASMVNLEAEETADMLVDKKEEYQRDKRDLKDLSVVKKEAVKTINDEVKSIIKRALVSPTQTAQETIDAIENKIKKEYFKLIKKEMGGIHQYGKSKLLVISEEYKAFHDLQHDIIVKGLPIKTIKRKYNTLFDTKKIGRELTPQGNAIYDIKLSKPKAEFINFFIKGKYTTLKNKQASLATEIAQALAAEAVYEILKDKDVLKQIAEMQELQGFTSVIGIENEIKNIGDNLDKKKGEERKFDRIKLSKDIAELSPEEKQKFYKGLPRLSKEYIKRGKSIPAAFNVIYPQPMFGKMRDSIIEDVTRYMKQYEVDKKRYEKVGEKMPATIAEVIRDEFRMQEEEKTLREILGLDASAINFRDKQQLEDVRDAVVKIADKIGIEKAARFLTFLYASGKIGGTRFINDGKGGLEVDPDFEIKRAAKGLIAKEKETLRYGIFGSAEDFTSFVLEGLPGYTKKYKSKIAKDAAQNVGKLNKGFNYENDLASAKINKAFLKEIAEVMRDLEAAGEITKNDIGMLMMSLSGDMRTPLAAAAQLQYYTKANNYSAKTHVYEHVIPRKVINMMLVGYATGVVTEADLDTMLDAFSVAVIPVEQDNIVGKFYKDSMPPAYIDILDRYFNMKTFGDVNMILIDAATGNPVPKSEAFSKAATEINVKQIKNSKDLQQIISKEPNNRDPKGISVFDFDETAGISENVVIARRGNEVVEISSADWPNVGEQMIKDGFEMDFSDFNKVTKGRPGPLMQKLKNQIKKYGRKDVFILTARAPQSQKAIHDYLLSEGVDIPIENITGLGESTADAKADWFIDKLAEGYNDFYFVDDALQNVKAVDNLLSQFDVKSKSVQARIKRSADMDVEINKIIEQNKGVEFQKRFKKSTARSRGVNKGRFKFWIPPGAEDFMGLMYTIATGKGKLGEAQLAFFRDNILKPYQEGVNNLNKARQAVLDGYKDLRKAFPNVTKKLNDIIPGTTFTYDAAVRVYLWDKAGMKIPEISKAVQKRLVDTVKGDPELQAFADGVGEISRRPEGYIKPEEDWVAETILADLDNATNKIARKEFLAEFIKNSDIIFSEENLNKIEATYGLDYREAIEDMLHRMTTGRNRTLGAKDRQVNRWTEWITNSIGAIMFLNMRSAILQTLSTVNFINWSDNNPVKAAMAFANQKQYWSDFLRIFNSDFLKQRRSGLAMDVNEAALASAIAGKKNKAKAALAYLLKLGFKPTQIADSFAISAGGATFLRNRINTYIKQGMSRVEAEVKAFEDFTARSNEAQQSSDPSLISKQQASILGRFILAFQNTPMQYARLMKKAGIDLIKGRGDWKTNVSRILYYGAIQNIIFASLQSALFALAFSGDEDEEMEKKKVDRLTNTVVDSILRGTGIYGAVVATAKNIMLEFYKQDKKGYKADHAYTMLQFMNLSPPIGSKMRKLYSATQTRKFNKEIMEEMGVDIDNPILPSIGQGVEAFTNIPTGRSIQKINNLREAFNEETEMWQRIALMLGWNTWDLGIKNNEVEDAKRRLKTQKQWEKSNKKTSTGRTSSSRTSSGRTNIRTGKKR